MNKKRIGILTLQYGANYGGTLQCYALYKVLQNMGHNVEVINFQPQINAGLLEKILYNYSMCRSFSDFKNTTKRFIFPKNNDSRTNDSLVAVFDKFRNENITLSERVDELTISRLNSKYDYIVVGSDQVWSSMVRSHLTYMGEWRPLFSGKFISYAACAYTNKYPLVRYIKIKRLLNNFSAISVRDNLTASLVEKFGITNAINVSDPTLLYPFKEFIGESIIKEPYIFIYILGGEINGGNAMALHNLKAKLKKQCKVVAATTYGKDIPYADITLHNIAPNEWINLISNSECVFTDSFHGILFSLKNRTPFVAYYREKLRASRLLDLQERYKIKNIVTEADYISYLNLSELIVNEESYRIFEEQKQRSLEYLKSNIY